MSGILNGLGGASGLGEALRTAGGVVSPDVYDQQNRERDIALNRLQQLQSQLISAVQNGAADPQALTKVGIPAGLVGPSPQAQAARGNLEADAKLREALKGRDIGKTSDDLMKVLTDAGLENVTGPMGEKLFAEVNRRKSREEAIQLKYEQLDQRRIEAEQRAEDKALDREARAQAQKEALELRRQLGVMHDATLRMGLELRRAAQADKEGQKLGPEELNTAGWEFLMFGKLPPGMGNASANQRAQVYAERTRLAQSMGLSPTEVAMMPQDNKVKMKAVGNLTNWGAMVGKSQEQLDKSLELAIQYAEKIGPGQIRALNKAVMAGRREFNDPTLNGYAAAIQTVAREYGRIMSGPTSNAMLPVEALKKADELLSTADSVESLKEKASVIKKDTQFTRQAVEDQLAGLRNSITNIGGEKPQTGKSAAPTGIPAGSTKIGKTPDGKDVWQSPDGKKWVE